jgi:signal transduction histidine kinase
MISSSELRRVTAFSDLPEEQIVWFLGCAEEVSARAGEAFIRQGAPADWMFVFLEGFFQWRGEFGGDNVSVPVQAGEVSGVFPFSRMERFTVTGRAVTDGRLLKFPVALFPELIQRMPMLTTRLVGMMSDRIREGTRIEQQRDRLVSLGKLAAGLAHELNNPASAAQSASGGMRQALTKMRRANAELWRRPLNESERARIEAVEASLLQSTTPLSGLALSDLEEHLDSILRSHGITNSWELSAALAENGMAADTLISLMKDLDAETVRIALTRIAAATQLSVLLSTVERGTARISDLILTVKEYTHMDQAPVENVDIHRSLETTLSALAHLLQNGVRVERTYQPVPLFVNSAGNDLNQVWTNIIENAIEAMAGQGRLRLQTSREDRYVVIEIGDSGPGIPAEFERHIFDPFFTTKSVGEGTGLGLNTVQTIVRKHGGSIQVNSKPGDTRFQVWLPCVEPSGLEPPLDSYPPARP